MTKKKKTATLSAVESFNESGSDSTKGCRTKGSQAENVQGTGKAQSHALLTPKQQRKKDEDHRASLVNYLPVDYRCDSSTLQTAGSMHESCCIASFRSGVRRRGASKCSYKQ